MKKIKEFMDTLLALLAVTAPIWVVVIIIAISFFIAYQISISDLPPWFKFWLLSGRR